MSYDSFRSDERPDLMGRMTMVALILVYFRLDLIIHFGDAAQEYQDSM